jgi:putative transposase
MLHQKEACMTISKELLDELLKGVQRPEDLLGDAGLMKELKIRLMERMLGAELTAHLGYEEGQDAPPGQASRRNGSSTKVLKGQDASCRWLCLMTATAASNRSW